LYIFLVSTFGLGNPPENAWDFFNRLFAEPQLPPIKFALFGLGNSQYVNSFNQAGRKVLDQLLQLDCQPVCEAGWGDHDQEDMEAQFEEWISSHFWPSIPG